MTIPEITKLIDAFRAEVETDAISPEDLGALLQRIVDALSDVNDSLNSLIGEDLTSAIDNFNEICSFLEGCTDDETLLGKLAEIKTSISANSDKIELNSTKIESINTEISKMSSSLLEHSQSIETLASKQKQAITALTPTVAVIDDSLTVTLAPTTTGGTSGAPINIPLPSATATTPGMLTPSLYRSIFSALSTVVLPFDGISLPTLNASVGTVIFSLEDGCFIEYTDSGWSRQTTKEFNIGDGDDVIPNPYLLFTTGASLYRALLDSDTNQYSLDPVVFSSDVSLTVESFIAELRKSVVSNASAISEISSRVVFPFDAIVKSPSEINVTNATEGMIVFATVSARFYRFTLSPSLTREYKFDYNDVDLNYARPNRTRIYRCGNEFYLATATSLTPILTASNCSENIPVATSESSGLLSKDDFARFDAVAALPEKLQISLKAERLIPDTDETPPFLTRLKLHVLSGTLRDDDQICLFRHGRKPVRYSYTFDSVTIERVLRASGWRMRDCSCYPSSLSALYYSNLRLYPASALDNSEDLYGQITRLYVLGATWLEHDQDNEDATTEMSTDNLIDFLIEKETRWSNYPDDIENIDADKAPRLELRAPSGWKSYSATSPSRTVKYGVGVVRDGVIVSNIAPFRFTVGHRQWSLSGDPVADAKELISVGT